MGLILPKVRESIGTLQKFLRKNLSSKQHQRVNFLFLIKSEKIRTKGEAAEILGVHRNTISAWAKEYERAGLKGLMRIGKPGGNRSPFTTQDLRRLRKRLSSPEGFGSYAEAQAWIEKELQVKLSLASTFYWVRIKLGASPKVARPRHEKKKPL